MLKIQQHCYWSFSWGAFRAFFCSVLVSELCFPFWASFRQPEMIEPNVHCLDINVRLLLIGQNYVYGMTTKCSFVFVKIWISLPFSPQIERHIFAISFSC